ncbi:MAG: sigma-70 family RNA polymerase sigma factor [Candidatus Azobacteroides sp.]|nr:sigma-70 family RNA polymerase sigma factor [Candidatus Azobacteroides sp.]
MSEEQVLVAGCKKNESWARKKLYEHYAPAMLGVCVRYTNDYEKAKDVLHEGFIKIFVKINTYSGEGSLSGWMRRIFVTTALEFLRADFPLRYMDDVIDSKDKIETNEVSAVEKLSAEDILKCISELPKGCGLVFNMYAIEGYSHAEIARMLNIKEGTSRSQFAHAKQLLQQKIQELHIHTNAKNKYG